MLIISTKTVGPLFGWCIEHKVWCVVSVLTVPVVLVQRPCDHEGLAGPSADVRLCFFSASGLQCLVEGGSDMNMLTNKRAIKMRLYSKDITSNPLDFQIFDQFVHMSCYTLRIFRGNTNCQNFAQYCIFIYFLICSLPNDKKQNKCSYPH